MLSILLWYPFLCAVFFLLLPKDTTKNLFYKRLSIALSFGHLVFSLLIFSKYNLDTKGFQFIEKYQWIPVLNASYHLGVDGLSLWMVVLTTLLSFICFISVWFTVENRVKTYISLFFLLEFFTLGVFTSLDSLLFYVFFEAVLIPMFMIIGIWGGKDKVYSAFKFFLYTLFGSLLFLIGLLFLILKAHTSSIPELQAFAQSLPLNVQQIIWLAFFLSFAVKVPMFPLHTWLPDAHVQAPTAGSVILAGVLIKMGAYGFIRFSLPMLPQASAYFQNFVLIISILAILYGSVIAIKQTDIKKMIAYSSVAHMGYVTAGLFAFNSTGYKGAIFQMLSHGLISGALFLCVGVIYDRLHTREFKDFGGLAIKMPNFAFFLMIFTMGSVGLPATSGFIGEAMVIISSFEVSPVYTLLIGSGVIFGAVYMLLMYKQTMFGEISNSSVHYLEDIKSHERFYLGLLSVLVVFFGIYPKLVISYI